MQYVYDGFYWEMCVLGGCATCTSFAQFLIIGYKLSGMVTSLVWMSMYFITISSEKYNMALFFSVI